MQQTVCQRLFPAILTVRPDNAGTRGCLPGIIRPTPAPLRPYETSSNGRTTQPFAPEKRGCVVASECGELLLLRKVSGKGIAQDVIRQLRGNPVGSGPVGVGRIAE